MESGNDTKLNKTGNDDKKTAESLLVCPFCKGSFTKIPDRVKIFECGWCRNRLTVEHIIPALSMKNIFSSVSPILYHIFLSNPESLIMKKIVSFGESWKENQKNMFVVIEMSVLCIIYTLISYYMDEHGSKLIIFTKPFFSTIPFIIALFYYIGYCMRRKELENPEIPVIRPEFRDI